MHGPLSKITVTIRTILQLQRLQSGTNVHLQAVKHELQRHAAEAHQAEGHVHWHSDEIRIVEFEETQVQNTADTDGEVDVERRQDAAV